MCEQRVDGFSWSPSGRALQADALRVLVVVQVLQGSFPELLPAGPTRRLRVPVWWPNQTYRQGNGGPLGRTSSSAGAARLSDEEEREDRARYIGMRGRGKHFFEREKENVFFMIQTVTSFFPENKPVSRRSTHPHPPNVISALSAAQTRLVQLTIRGSSKGTRMQ